MDTQLIKFYDDEKSEYPLIEIKEGYKDEFKTELNEYRKEFEGEYTFDEFMDRICDKEWFIRELSFDLEVFF